ncbi:MAG: hypothetical protein D6730_13990 [Bacteroidetes bacterium]|nr:MAG: hypothetical protein D6730_13990 [Bacteroidota bacterium]
MEIQTFKTCVKHGTRGMVISIIGNDRERQDEPIIIEIKLFKIIHKYKKTHFFYFISIFVHSFSLL